MKLTMTAFQSMDGVMQAPGAPDEDRDGGFDKGGWLVPYADEDMGAAVSTWFGEADAFLLGRRTYEIFAAYWPNVPQEGDPVATALNQLPKYVATRTLTSLEWNGSTPLNGDVAEQVRELKAKPGREIQVHGSANLLQTLIKHDLIDEYRLFTYPVLLGDGKRLFEPGGPARAMKLVDTKKTSTGVTIDTYRPAGDLSFGSF